MSTLSKKDKTVRRFMLRALNTNKLGVPDDSVKLVGGFGGNGLREEPAAPAEDVPPSANRPIMRGPMQPRSLNRQLHLRGIRGAFWFGCLCELVKTYKKDTRCLDMICMAATLRTSALRESYQRKKGKRDYEDINCRRCGRRRVCGGQGQETGRRSEIIMFEGKSCAFFQLRPSLLSQRHGKEQRCPGYDESGRSLRSSMT